MATKATFGNGLVRVESDLFKDDFVEEANDFEQIDMANFEHEGYTITFNKCTLGGIGVAFTSSMWLESTPVGEEIECDVEFV